jgi:predicted DNA-binding protein with PD1-like motif
MEYQKLGDTYFVRLDRGEEVLDRLTALCRKEGITLAQVDGLGAVDEATVCVYDVPSKQFFRKTFSEPMEISNLCGTVTQMNGEVYLHIHATVCDGQLNAHDGHVNALRVSATCELTVRTVPGTVGRVHDDSIGLNIFSFENGTRL